MRALREDGRWVSVLQVENNLKLIPATGVYAVKCSLGHKELKGIMNIGYRPTFEDDKRFAVEVHIFKFDRDIYGEELGLEFVKRIRPERKFNSKEGLIAQIENDKIKAAKILNVDYK